MSGEPGAWPDRPTTTLRSTSGPVDSRARIDAIASVTLVVIGWVGAAGVLGASLLPMMFLDDCDQPACHMARGVHVYCIGVALTVIVAYAAARWALRPRGRRRWPYALLVPVVCLWCVATTLFVVYRAIDVHPEYFGPQQLR